MQVCKNRLDLLSKLFNTPSSIFLVQTIIRARIKILSGLYELLSLVLYCPLSSLYCNRLQRTRMTKDHGTFHECHGMHKRCRHDSYE